jgi:ankyrin repeat protein
MRELLDSGVAVDSSDEHGCTALHFAADRDQTAALRMLAGAGADVNAADDEGQTPLHYAAICGHELVGGVCGVQG